MIGRKQAARLTQRHSPLGFCFCSVADQGSVVSVWTHSIILHEINTRSEDNFTPTTRECAKQERTGAGNLTPTPNKSLDPPEDRNPAGVCPHAAT
jgi:hypothetical protein